MFDRWAAAGFVLPPREERDPDESPEASQARSERWLARARAELARCLAEVDGEP
jgi:hypothetical protein